LLFRKTLSRDAYGIKFTTPSPFSSFDEFGMLAEYPSIDGFFASITSSKIQEH
jgi:hypothetical protein